MRHPVAQRDIMLTAQACGITFKQMDDFIYEWFKKENQHEIQTTSRVDHREP